MMKTISLAALIASTAAAAMAGGYSAPIVEAAPAQPVVVTTVQPTGEWTGFYAGLQYGKAEADLDGIDVDGDNYGVHAGYLRDFGRFVGGAELSYDKLDDFDVGGIDLGDVDGNLLRGKLLAGYDAGPVLPYAAISLARGELEIGGDEESETGVGFGLGVKYMATPRFMLGAEWMRNSFEVDTDTGSDVDVDLDTLSLNASFRF